MDAGQPIRIGIPEAGGDERTPVPALRAEPLIAEHPGHQLGQAVRHSLNPEARLAWREGQAAAGQRCRDDREPGRWVRSEPPWVGQPRDELQELENGTGPAVREVER